jgi:CubicO group peptidase (beta-lactamase class C family)
MRPRTTLLIMALAVGWLAGAASNSAAADTNAGELAGLWQAKRRFGPDIRGTLLITQSDRAWQAEIAGRAVPAGIAGETIRFRLADGRDGEFRGTFNAARTTITGHWIQERRVDGGMPYASPVTLAQSGTSQWRGEVAPVDDALTFYLMIAQGADGSVTAFLRNPERNLGWFRYRANALERDSDRLRLIATSAGKDRRVVAEGTYRRDPETLSFYFDFGGTYDFTRVENARASAFYPRGVPGDTYAYAKPPQLDDGWQTASADDVGLSRQQIERFIRKLIDTPIDSPSAQEDHAVLIARHGKLVVEEYFHGASRERPHDTRSAAKSVASDLFGAALYAGLPVSTSARVYEVMNGGTLPPGLEARKQALTVEHLLTMSSGFDCDESNPDSPGYEDKMWEQTTHPDFYRWTMDLAMVREPGEKAVYCSANPNLIGGVIARATGRYLPALFHELIAEPLQIRRYYLPISPTGDFTMTGGARFLPRDFLKLAQLHLNGGTWNGRRVYSREWSEQATAARYPMGTKLQYGYLWWMIDYPYKDRSVRGYFAAGNGGQVSMAIPDLELAMAFYAGNFNDAGGRTASDVYVPQYLLPAIDE